ncbi:MAG: MmcQ/YjbR family DNA-binding protein [Eubacterium sp.]|nr:MmcQ/YjbR family DNA-binding protein [Eubacterium sp.]
MEKTALYLPGYAVLRHGDTRKWYALIMDVPKGRLGLSGNGSIDILNVKCDPVLSGSLRMEKGFLPAYHMHRENWITILLDGTVEKEKIFPLLEMSF